MFLNTLLSVALAGPEGAQVVNGQVSIQQSGYNTTITASDKAIINYSSFDIARPEIVQFIQPASSASVLNRILSANPTNINGTLLANGRVFFVNPAGVYIGAGARVNVNQLVASGLNITNSDFINGRFNFEGGNGSVINGGDISAEKVYLIGKQVDNSGSIHCPAGYVVMAAGDRVFLSEPGSDVMVEIDPQTSSDPAALADSGPDVLSQGEVDAAGGRIVLAAGDIHTQAISNVGSLAASIEIDGAGQISNTGTIEARSDTATGGTIIAKAAEVTNSGTVDVTGSEGGEVAMEATGHLGQFGIINADGTTGNGGNVELRADDVVALSSDSLTTANAGTHGDGGDVIAFSPDTVLFREGAQIEAKGGSESGDGGFVEVSGKEHVEVFGLVNTSAEAGTNGTFLIDPANVEIQTVDDGASSWSGANPDIFTPGQASATINTATLTNNLGNGSVTVTTNGALGQDGDITVTNQIDLDGGNGNTLTLQAHDDIIINAAILDTDLSTPDAVNIVLDASDGAPAPGDPKVNVDIGASIDTYGGSFTSSGVDFDNTGGEITTSGGNVNLDGHTGSINIGASIVADTGDISTISGSSVLVRAQASGITAGNVDIDTTGTFACEPGSRITAGGDGTDLNVNAGDIALNVYGVGNETLTNTGNGTITLTASGDTFLTDHSINVDEGTVDIDSANIRTSLFGVPMVPSPQRAENNSDILAAAGTGSEIKANGLVSLTAGAIGDEENPLDLDGANALEITTSGARSVRIREQTSTIQSTTLTVAEPPAPEARIYIDYAERDGNHDRLSIWGDDGHYIGGADLDNDTGSSLSYTAGNGDIVLGAAEASVIMGENGSLVLSTPDEIVYPEGWQTWPLIITTGGSVSLTAKAIHGYSYSERLPTSDRLTLRGVTELTLNDTGPGPMWLAELHEPSISSTSITVGNAGYGTIDIAYHDDRGAVDIDDAHLLNNVLLPFSFSYTATEGDIRIGLVDAGTANVTLEASAGAIRDAVDDTRNPETEPADVIGGAIQLTARRGGVGVTGDASGQDLVPEILAHVELSADTTTDAADIAINGVQTVPVGLINAGKGNVTLAVTYGAGAAIRDAVDDSSDPDVDIIAGTIDLTGGRGGIGTVEPAGGNGGVAENRVLEVTASNALNAYPVKGSNADIYIDSIGDLPVGLVNSVEGSVTLRAMGAIRDAVDDSGAPLADVVGTTVNLRANASGIGTPAATEENGILEVIVGGELRADTTADGADILISNTDNLPWIGLDLPLGSVDAGAGDVTLVSVGAIRDATDDSAQPQVDVVGVTINLTARQGGIGTEGLVADNGEFPENGVLEVVASRELNADTSADSGHILISSIDDLLVGLVDAGMGSVTFDSTDAINDAFDDKNVDIIADMLTLSADDEIGGNPTPGKTTDTLGAIETTVASLDASSTTAGDIVIIEIDGIILTDVDTVDGDITIVAGGAITATDVQTTDGAINLTAGGSLTATLVSAADASDDEEHDVTLSTTGAGNVTLTSVTADDDIMVSTAAVAGDILISSITAADDISLTATQGAIREAVDYTEDTNIRAVSVQLSAATAIIGNSPIETSARSITARTDGGDIDIDNDNTLPIMASLEVSTGAGNIKFRQTGGGALTAQEATTQDGTIHIEVDSAELTVGNITAGGQGNIIVRADGDVKVGNVTALDNQITINSAGAIKESVNDRDVDLTAASLALTAKDGIGIHRSGESLDIKIPVPIETDAASIVAQTEDNAESSSHIFINVQNTEYTSLEASTVGTGSCIAFRQADGGELTLGALHTSDGSITVGADGDVKVGSITAFDNQITIDSAGAIDDAAVDVVTDFTAKTLMLTAYDGIGATAEIETDVSSLSAHSIASDIMIVEKDTTSLDRINLTDVDTIDGRINITVEEAVGATGDTVLTAVDADGDDDEDEVVITAAAGDITIGEVSADNVSLEATQGSINDASDDTITDITGDLLTLTARDEIGGSPTAGTTTYTRGAIEVASNGLDVSVNTAGNIVLTESDGTELTDVDTVNGSIDIASTTGDLTVGDIDATTTVSLEATTGSINDAADDTIVDITANVLTLTARDQIGVDPTSGFTNTAIETTVASLDASSNTAGDIVITETDNVILQDIQTTNGNITLQATGGAMTHQIDKTITANGGSLTMTQRDSLDLKDFTFSNQVNTDLTAQSYNGSFTADNTKVANAADNWKSITATSDSGITLQGSGDITTNALTSTNGDITVESKTGAVVMNDTVKTNEGGGVTITAQDDVTAQAITTKAQAVTTNSNIEIHSLDGDLEINDNLTANGGGVSLIADNGKITTEDATAKTGIQLEGPGNITTQALTTTTGNISVHSTGGDLILGDATAQGCIILEGSGDITTSQLTTTMGNISVHSTAGNLILNGAINACGGHERGSSDKPLRGGGGVELIADTGKIYTPDSLNPTARVLDVPITGYSDDVTYRQDPTPDSIGSVSPGRTGVVLPDGSGVVLPDGSGVVLPDGSGKAAIVIRSKDDLNLGPNAELTANGNYRIGKTGVDDRPGVGFKSRGEGSGDPIDVAIYVGNSDLEDLTIFRESEKERHMSKGGDVTVKSDVWIDRGGTMVIDAENTVNDFGKKFTTSWKESWERNKGTNRLEVVSRRTQTLDEAVKYRTLPHAEKVRQGKAPSWFKEETPTWFKGENPTWFEVETPTWFGGSKYVLRGKRVAEVLTNVESAPMDSDQDERRRRRERLEEEDHIPAAPLDIRDRYDNRVRKIEQGMPLRNGYKIKTGEDIRSFIEFPDGTEIIVEPNTSVTIESGGIFVSSGKIWFWSMFTSPIGGFKIRTAHVTINLTGTEGGVEVSPDGEATSVWTLKDQVDIKDQVVREGEAALIWQDLIFAKNPLLAQESDDLQKRLNDGKGAHIQKAGWFPLSFIGALTPSPRFFWESIPQ